MVYWKVALVTAGCLAAVFGVCRLLIWRWTAFEGGRYDERQLADQGRAGKAAFGAVMLYLGILQLLRMLEADISMEMLDSLIWMGILLGIGVYGTVTVWTNAYPVFYQKWKTVTAILLGLGLIHVADYLDIGYVYREGKWWHTGLVVSQRGIFVDVDFWVKLVVGLVWLYLALLVVLRRKLDERDDRGK